MKQKSLDPEGLAAGFERTEELRETSLPEVLRQSTSHATLLPYHQPCPPSSLPTYLGLSSQRPTSLPVGSGKNEIDRRAIVVDAPYQMRMGCVESAISFNKFWPLSKPMTTPNVFLSIGRACALRRDSVELQWFEGGPRI